MSRTLLVSLAALSLACSAAARAPPQAPASGKRVRRLLIHNAIVVDGNGTPASGPKDIVIENNTIADVIPLDPVAAARGPRGPAGGGRGGASLRAQGPPQPPPPPPRKPPRPPPREGGARRQAA